MLLLRGATVNFCLILDFFRFQYMLLLRGATFASAPIPFAIGFNTCSSCEEQLKDYNIVSHIFVSIHAPLARSNRARQTPDARRIVSIHAPLARSNSPCSHANAKARCFNTCSSCEEQLRTEWMCESDRRFQYMLLLRGATRTPTRSTAKRLLFQYMLLLRGATA